VGRVGWDVVASVILRVVPSNGFVVLSVIRCVVPSNGLEVVPLIGFNVVLSLGTEVVAFVSFEMVKLQLQLQVDKSALSNPSDLQLQFEFGAVPSDGFGIVVSFVAVQRQLQVDKS
jgi:hypothetical protein